MGILVNEFKFNPVSVEPGYPTNEGDVFDAVPASLVGSGGSANFPSTARDIALALVVADGIVAPTITPLYNPPVFRQRASIAYLDGAASPPDSAFRDDITLTQPVARALRVQSDVALSDALSSPPLNRGFPHGVQARSVLENFEKVTVLGQGQWADTSGASISSTPPPTISRFKPAATVIIEALDPESQVETLGTPLTPTLSPVPGTARTETVTSAGLAYTLPLDPLLAPYSRYGIIVSGAVVYYRTGDALLTGGDVNTPAQVGTDDPSIPIDPSIQILDLTLGGDTHIAFRTEAVAATIIIFALE